jgi:mRNA-degrading endonuclease RelE of RelBE toxin-antitoxin system
MAQVDSWRISHNAGTTQRDYGISTTMPGPSTNDNSARKTSDREIGSKIAQIGYHLARMRYEIVLAPEAIDDFRRLRAIVRSSVRDAIETRLRHQPTRQSRSRIKRLRGVERPHYRLRVDEVRIFYDVVGSTVEILAIIPKSEADRWLSQFANRP